MFLFAKNTILALMAISLFSTVSADDFYEMLDASVMETVFNQQSGETIQPHGHHCDKKKMKEKIRKVCKKVGLTDEQKQGLKIAFKAFMKSTKVERSTLKTAKKNYAHSLFLEGTTIEDAEAAAEDLGTAYSAFQPKKTAFSHDVLFNHLNQSQRWPFAKCIMVKKKMKKRIYRCKKKK